MFCPKCGSWNPEDEKTCRACGATMNKEEKPEEEMEATQPLTPVPPVEDVSEATESPEDEVPIAEAVPIEEEAPKLDLDPDQYLEKARSYGEADYYEEFFHPDKAQAPYRPTPPPPAPRKRGFSAYQTILVVALVAFLAILFFGRRLLRPRFTPQAVSEHFFVALANNSPKEALRLLDREEESLQLNDQSLAILQKFYQLDKVSSYSVIDEGFIMDTIKGNKGNLKKDLTIEYMVEGSQEVYKFPLTLEKKNTRSFLFFDNWKVRPETYALDEFQIKVPPSAQVSIDGKIVSQNFLDRERGDDGWDIYRLPGILRGDHLLEISGKGIPLVKEVVSVDDRHKTLSMADLPLSPEAIQALNQQALKNFRTILLSAAQDKDFETIAPLFLHEDGVRQNAERKYQALKNDLKKYSNFTVDKVRVQAFPKTDEVLIKASCTKTLAQTSLWEKLAGAFSSDDYTMKVAFRFVDGKWVQANFNAALPWD